MNATTFDTLAAVKALREAGFEARQAEAVADIVRHAIGTDRDTLVTKADLAASNAALRDDLRADNAEREVRLTWRFVGMLTAFSALIVAAVKFF